MGLRDNMPANMSLEAHHYAGMIVMAAVLFLVAVDYGFRGIKI